MKMIVDFVSEKIKIKRKNLFKKLFHRKSFFALLHGGKNFRVLDHRLSITEAAIEMLPENSCTFYDRRTILVNIVHFKEFLS